MSVQPIEKLLVCFISALDLRRINRETTPYIARLLDAYPSARTTAFPEVDLDPTLLTGVYPHEHGIWQVKLKFDLHAAPAQTLTDRAPDMVTTTAQCFVHLLTGPYDLAAVPRWRRRRFEINKTRYMRRNADEFQRLNGVGTIFSALGKDDCSYVYSQRLDELSSLFLSLGSGERRLEFFEAHSMDTLQHWNLDDPSKIASSYHQVDRFVNALHATCESNGVRMMLLSDHGMELVTEFIDIIGGLKALGLRRDEYTFFVEAPKARFWAHTDRARRRITEMLSALDHGTFLSYQDLHRYNLKFEDARYGEFYFIADPGQIFFPHDYHHPLANLFMGLTHEHQRSRLQSPKYRGYHGYLPHHESEKGLLILLDDRYKFRQPEMSIIDVAPTILTVLGEKPPDHMKGRCVLEM